jgi:signal transduction histidine kinase
VRDDGVGFDPDARSIASRRLGLVSMRERIEAIGGTFEIVSAPGRGTTVRAAIPPPGIPSPGIPSAAGGPGR